MTAIQVRDIIGTVSTNPALSMDKKAVSERLRALASDDHKRSKAARLRDVIDDVETALAAGVSRVDVLTELKAHGLEMSLATFETTLKRLRAKRGQRTGKPAPTSTPATVPPQPDPELAVPATTSGPSDLGKGSHNPADIDRIISNKPDLAALTKIAKRSRK